MSKEPYLYNREVSTCYRFLSTGRKPLEKVVEFTPLAFKNIYNLGFGDLLANGEIDDKASSNNGDIIKVLSTVIHIIKDFPLKIRAQKLYLPEAQKKEQHFIIGYLKPILINSGKNS